MTVVQVNVSTMTSKSSLSSRLYRAFGHDCFGELKTQELGCQP